MYPFPPYPDDLRFPGSQGFQGSQGSQGNQGDVGGFFGGKNGLDGSQGPQGDEGAQGFQGFQGVQGLTGTQGNQGSQGATFNIQTPVINLTFTSGSAFQPETNWTVRVERDRSFDWNCRREWSYYCCFKSYLWRNVSNCRNDQASYRSFGNWRQQRYRLGSRADRPLGENHVGSRRVGNIRPLGSIVFCLQN